MEKIYQVAEISVEYIPGPKFTEMPQIKTSKDAFKILSSFYSPRTLQLQEQFVVVYLNQANRVIGAYKCSLGGITGTVADIRLILGVGLKIAATGIIISHNHPSGSLVPSHQDNLLTDKMNEACRMMDLKLMDHLIIGPEASYKSFADEGWI